MRAAVQFVKLPAIFSTETDADARKISSAFLIVNQRREKLLYSPVRKGYAILFSLS